jgi:hypothetical protein
MEMKDNIPYDDMEIRDGRPYVRPPTLDEYAVAKKELEIHVDPAVPGGDMGVESVVDMDTFLLIYWNVLPKDKKHKVDIGDTHDKNKFPT